MKLNRAVAVALGATLGAGLRWAAIRELGEDAGDLALLAVNVAGCLALALVAELPERVDPELRALLGAGVCGSLTTWSALAVQVGADVRAGAWATATGWLAANLAVGIMAAIVGRAAGQRCWGGVA